MYEIGNADTDQIQHHHRCSEDAHVQDIGRRRHDRGNREYEKNGITQVTPQPARGNDAHQRQKEDKNWQFKNNSQTHNQHSKKIGVLSDSDHWLELLALVNQEIKCCRIDDLEAKETSTEEQSNSRQHERNDVFL